MRHRLVAAAGRTAPVEPQCGYPSLEVHERELVKLPMRCGIVVVKQKRGTVAGLYFWLPPQRGKRGIDGADDVRRQERQLRRSKGVERQIDPAIGLARGLVDARRQHRLSALGDEVTDSLASDVPRLRRS